MAVTAGQRYRSPGVQMFRFYGPDCRGDPTIEKWAFAICEDDPDHGAGWLIVTVGEIVETERSGTLAVYHKQWFSPEGEPLARARRMTGNLASLKALISRRQMQLDPSSDNPQTA